MLGVRICQHLPVLCTAPCDHGVPHACSREVALQLLPKRQVPFPGLGTTVIFVLLHLHAPSKVPRKLSDSSTQMKS